MYNFDSPASGPLDSAVELRLTDEQLQDCIDAERTRYVLTEADADADLAGTPRPAR